MALLVTQILWGINVKPVIKHDCRPVGVAVSTTGNCQKGKGYVERLWLKGKDQLRKEKGRKRNKTYCLKGQK